MGAVGSRLQPAAASSADVRIAGSDQCRITKNELGY